MHWCRYKEEQIRNIFILFRDESVEMGAAFLYVLADLCTAGCLC